MDAERQKKFTPHIDVAGAKLAGMGIPEDQVKFLIDSLIVAIVGFDGAKPDATDDAAQKIVEKLTDNLVATYNRKQAQLADKHSKRSRQIRKEQVDSISEEHGIKFTYLREETRFVWPTAPVDDADSEVQGQLPDPERYETEEGEKIGVIAYKYHLGHKGRLGVELAMSFCSPRDNWNNLDGKEEALKHFLEGKTLTLEASHGALFGSLLGRPSTVAIQYAKDVLKADGVVRRLKIDSFCTILLGDGRRLIRA
jgi:hypothetical protein